MLDFDSMEKFLAHNVLTIVEGNDVGLTLKKGDRLRPQACLKQGEAGIGSDIMRARAVECRGDRSLADGFYLLANQDDVLGEFPDFIYIILSGTLLCDSDGNIYMACLFFDGDRWNIMDIDFERKYDDGDFFACHE